MSKELEELIKKEGIQSISQQLMNYILENDMVFNLYDMMTELVKTQHKKITHEYTMFKEYANYTGQAHIKYDKTISATVFLNIVRFHGLYGIHHRIKHDIIEWLKHNNTTPESFPNDVKKYISEVLQDESNRI